MVPPLGLESKREYTFADFVDWYLELPKVKRKKSYKDDVRKAEILKEEFGQHLARDIKPAMVESFQDALLERQCQRKKNNFMPASVNRVVAVMKRIFNLAMREELVERNPCFKVSMLPENNKRDRVLTNEEFERQRDFFLSMRPEL